MVTPYTILSRDLKVKKNYDKSSHHKFMKGLGVAVLISKMLNKP